jgi:plastocyanin
VVSARESDVARTRRGGWHLVCGLRRQATQTFTRGEETVMNLKTSTWLLGIALAMALGAAASCGGGSDNSTSPAGGGGTRELNSGDFGPRATFQHRFATAGTFPYHCIHHSPMTGSVLVSATATDSLVNVSITSDHAPFPGATVKPGGRVVWTNNTSMVHTVTSN